MCTFLFWMVHCWIWDRYLLGFARLVYPMSLVLICSDTVQNSDLLRGIYYPRVDCATVFLTQPYAPLFFVSRIIKIFLTYWISRMYLTDAVTGYVWRHLSATNDLIHTFAKPKLPRTERFDERRFISRSLGPFSLTWFNFNPSMVITCPIKCGVKLLIHSQTSTAAPLKFGNGYVISFHILWWM